MYIKEVLDRCEALKRAGIWLPEPKIRPRAWIENFEVNDKILAAQLLDRFIFYDQQLTDSLLTASFYSIADGLKKGPMAPSSDQLLQVLPGAIFTPVCGEIPNPTDSGNFLCRRARQLIGVDEAQIKVTSEALKAAEKGCLVVFIDDFIGSGDQFISTWQDSKTGVSFESIQKQSNFPAIYISLVGAEEGIKRIGEIAPTVAVCVTHKINKRDTLWGIKEANPTLYEQIDALLHKYSRRLSPAESYMKKHNYLVYGYKDRGFFLGFEHSVPDATLPIFWCRGIDNNWEPLIERT